MFCPARRRPRTRGRRWTKREDRMAWSNRGACSWVEALYGILLPLAPEVSARGSLGPPLKCVQVPAAANAIHSIIASVARDRSPAGEPRHAEAENRSYRSSDRRIPVPAFVGSMLPPLLHPRGGHGFAHPALRARKDDERRMRRHKARRTDDLACLDASRAELVRTNGRRRLAAARGAIPL